MNLSTARRLVAKNLTDSCRIERDRAGYHDDVLEMATGKLLKRPVVPDVVWSGPCMITPTGIGQTVEGARVVERRGYRVRVPWDAPEFFRGDRIVVTAAADAQLVNRQLVLIDGTEGATLDHCTILSAQDVEGVAAS